MTLSDAGYLRYITQLLREKDLCGHILLDDGGDEQACILPMDHDGHHGETKEPRAVAREYDIPMHERLDAARREGKIEGVLEAFAALRVDDTERWNVGYLDNLEREVLAKLDK